MRPEPDPADAPPVVEEPQPAKATPASTCGEGVGGCLTMLGGLVLVLGLVLLGWFVYVSATVEPAETVEGGAYVAMGLGSLLLWGLVGAVGGTVILALGIGIERSMRRR
ncbi:MAG: hypothetical protein ACYTG6_12285 [Planctomycetota bacterium]